MKRIYYIGAFVAVMLIALYSCDGSPYQLSTTPPGQITNVEFTPLNGGGFFTYTIPTDEDFLYVRAEFTIDNGDRIVRTSSVHSESLIISGLGTVKEYEIRLYSVNRNGDRSQPVIRRVTPLEPHTDVVIQTVEVRPGFASVIIEWENELSLPINVFATVTVGNTQTVFVQSSNLPTDRWHITQLEGVPHHISVLIQDIYGNETQSKDLGQLTPLIDGSITKRYWSFLRDSRLWGNRWDHDSHTDPWLQTPFPQYITPETPFSFPVGGFRNAREVQYAVNISVFWDNEYDYRPIANRNMFLSGRYGFPFSYFIDMGREIKASRVRVWQRDIYIYATAASVFYSGQNIRTFELWISNDQTPEDGILDDWEFVGRYIITQPTDPMQARLEARGGHEFVLFPDDPAFTRPFRYLRFVAIDAFSSGADMGSLSEITLFGTEADGSIIYDPETLVGIVPGRDSI